MCEYSRYESMNLDGNLLCKETDLNGITCSTLETFFGLGALDRTIHALNLSSDINLLFQSNPFNATNYESMAESINLIIFKP